MNYGYEIIKEALETAVYSAVCFRILGLRKKEDKYFWGIMILSHILVWGGLVCMKADDMVAVPVCTLFELGLPVAVAEGKLAKRIVASFFSYTVMSITTIIVSLVLQFALDTSQDIRQIISILVILALIMILCIIQDMYRITFINIERIRTEVLLVLGLFGFGVSGFISNILRKDFNSKGAVYINIIAMAVLIVSFVLCFTILLLINHKNAGMEQMNRENKSIIESQQKYVQEILGDREEIRGMYHDLDKMVLTLNTLLESGHYEEAIKMIGRMNQELNGGRHLFVYTYDALADAVIYVSYFPICSPMQSKLHLRQGKTDRYDFI